MTQLNFLLDEYVQGLWGRLKHAIQQYQVHESPYDLDAVNQLIARMDRVIEQDRAPK